MDVREWKAFLDTSAFEESLALLYGQKAHDNKPRYERLLDLYQKTYGEAGTLKLFSAPGRTEIGGNHTDHQQGRVLAASVDMDMIAAASATDDGMIRVKSEGYREVCFACDDLEVKEREKNSTGSLIRGVAAGFANRGHKIGGFRAVVTSNVLRGSGISSSAAYETLIGNIINTLYCEGKENAERIAMIGQYAENVYFGKPSGLMDQMASSVGNVITIDFKEKEAPAVRRLDVDFEQAGLALCITNCGADHADLTDEYAAIPIELKKICSMFGKDVLRQVSKEEFMERLPEIRQQAGDRAVLRALHFYGDNDRVPCQVAALENGDIDTFLQLTTQSGISSWTLLQNIVPAGSKEHQEMGVALALSRELLGGEGATRVHGGGFAGTIQAFVPQDRLASYAEGMEKVFGKGSCFVLQIRPVGGFVFPE